MEGLKPSFQVIKIPSGGQLAWTLEGEGEDPDIVPAMIGVILDHYTTRAYWKNACGAVGGGGMPDCSSIDAKTGSRLRTKEQIGDTKGQFQTVDVFGECASCHWSKFGTAVNASGTPMRGQACQVNHRVFLLMPERSIFPVMIALSVMSAEKKYPGSITTYAVSVGSKLKRLSEVVTKVKLAEDKNADGIKYAKATFWFVADLNDEEKKKVAALKQMFTTAMRQKPFEADEEEGGFEENGGVPEGDPWDKKETEVNR